MPTYEFRNTKTNDIIERFFSVAKRDELVASGEWEVYHSGSAATIGDPVRMGHKKPDRAFRDLLKHIKKGNSKAISKSTINDW
jgi:hypothetical protein